MPPRYAPANPLPPYSYVPGHDLAHPVTDPRGHSYAAHAHTLGGLNPPAVFAHLPTDPASRRRVLAATLAADPQWLYALDLFNGGWYWESHEAWEGFWHALGRTTPEARFVQGLIHLAAAAVKAREGKPNGVARHTQRAQNSLAAHGRHLVAAHWRGFPVTMARAPVSPLPPSVWLPRASPPWLPNWMPTNPNAGTHPGRPSCGSWPVSCGWRSRRGTGETRSPRALRWGEMGCPGVRRRPSISTSGLAMAARLW